MSRQRAKHLVELTKKKEYSVMSIDINSEISLHTVENGKFNVLLRTINV